MASAMMLLRTIQHHPKRITAEAVSYEARRAQTHHTWLSTAEWLVRRFLRRLPSPKASRLKAFPTALAVPKRITPDGVSCDARQAQEHARADFLRDFRKSAVLRHAPRRDPRRMAQPRFPVRGKSSLRIGRTSEPGRIYLVTFVTRLRQVTFLEWEAAHAASMSLQSTRLWQGSRLLCWVLMPDHWHGLIQLGELDSISSVVGRAKGAMARAVNAAEGRNGSGWATGFHDHAIRAEDDLRHVARYVIRNPVRAGLVERVGEYPFWDAVWIES